MRRQPYRRLVVPPDAGRKDRTGAVGQPGQHTGESAGVQQVSRRTVVGLVQRRDVEPGLAVEVARDQRRIDPGPLADLAGRGSLITLLAEQRGGRRQQAGAARHRLLSSRTGQAVRWAAGDRRPAIGRSALTMPVTTQIAMPRTAAVV